jgi:hypothetical protein
MGHIFDGPHLPIIDEKAARFRRLFCCAGEEKNGRSPSSIFFPLQDDPFAVKW